MKAGEIHGAREMMETVVVKQGAFILAPQAYLLHRMSRDNIIIMIVLSVDV